MRLSLGRLRRITWGALWDIEVSSLSRLPRLGVKLLRVLHLVVRGFLDDECPLHASALTFHTVLAIVPVLALSVALAKGFGGSEIAERKLLGAVEEWARTFEVPGSVTGAVSVPDGDASLHIAARIETAIGFAFDKADAVSFRALGAVGLVFLVWTVVMVLGQVESSFNRVWGVAAGRPLWRKFTDYLTVVLVLPFLLLIASSLPVVDAVSALAGKSAGPLLDTWTQPGFARGVVVLAAASLAFTFVLRFMPHTRVRAWPGFAGGLMTAVLLLGWLRVCAALQVGVAGYSRLYGGFAVFPILLAWMYTSWAIVLFGAEVAFAVQNASTYRMELGGEHASVESRLTVALSLLTVAAGAMLDRGGCLETPEFARSRRVSVRLLNAVARQLVELGLLAEVADRPGCFVLLRPPGAVKVRDVVEALLTAGSAPGGVALPSVDAAVVRAVAGVRQGAVGAPGDTTLEDLSREALRA